MRLRLPTLRKFRSSKDPFYGLPEPFGTDLRQLGPLHVCPCGSMVFNVAGATTANFAVGFALGAGSVISVAFEKAK